MLPLLILLPCDRRQEFGNLALGIFFYLLVASRWQRASVIDCLWPGHPVVAIVGNKSQLNTQFDFEFIDLLVTELSIFAICGNVIDVIDLGHK